MPELTTVLTGPAAASVVPLHPLLQQRWSPRGFDADAELGDVELTALLEAARWAPSSRNRQPWRFLLGRRVDGIPDEAFTGIHAALMPANRSWAGSAGALIVAFAETADEAGRAQPGVEYDLGLAVGQLALQAAAQGLHLRQMGGFSAAAVRHAFDVPDRFTPMVVIAVGRLASPADLPVERRGRETAPRSRRPLAEIAYGSRWGSAVQLASPPLPAP